MVFRNDLYYAETEGRTDDGAVYTLRLNADHIIYKAHFPGEPITPGVCILQIGVELLSDYYGERLELDSVKNVKFLSILRPDGGPVRVRIHHASAADGRVKAQVDLSKSDTPVAKMSLLCRTAAK